MKKNDSALRSMMIIEEEIKCPLCGEVLRRSVEREIPVPIEERHDLRIEKEPFHFVNSNSLAHLFLHRRMDQHLRIEDLSERIGFSSDYIEAVERGEKVPTIRYALKCSQIFGVNPEWIKGRWIKEMVSAYERRLMSRINWKEDL